VDVVLSYCHHTLCDRSLEAALPYLASKGVGVINASPLCMGLLTPQGPPDWHPAPPALRAAAAAAAAAAAEGGVGLPRLALADCVQNVGIATNLVGLCTPAQVDENVDAVLQALGLAPNPAAAAEAAALGRVRAALAPVMGTTWESGRPENN
jgi:L-galactose dehydrogenase